MPSLKKEQIEAAEAFVSTTIELLASDQGVHAETAVAGAARMAGTFLFRSFKFPMSDIRPGQTVFSEQANDHGPALIELLAAALEWLGVVVDPAKVAGTTPEHQPNLAFLDTQKSLEPKFEATRQRLRLSEPEAAQSAVVAAAMLIQRTAGVLDPTAAFGVAVYGFIEGSKTAPDPVSRA